MCCPGRCRSLWITPLAWQHWKPPSGEGVQNLLCAAQALAALIAVIAAGAGVTVIDPLAALLIAGIAAKEGRELWRGEDCSCHTIAGLATTSSNTCQDDSRTK